MSYKVVNAMKTGTYESQYGEDDGSGKKVMVKYTVQFEGSDDAVEVSQKPTTAAPKPGDEMDGTIETTQYGKRFKKAAGSGDGFNRAAGPATRASIEAQTSLNAAVTTVRDYYALLEPGTNSELKLSEYVGKVVQVSKVFAGTLAGKDVGADPVATVQEVMPGAEEVKPENDTINLDDIPF
jgi:hypothetical protein